MDKKNLMAPYQQSFRIDDLLTRKVSEQQPPHFCPPLLATTTTTASSNNNNSNDSLQPSPLTSSLQPPPLSNLLPPPLGQLGGRDPGVKMESSMPYHSNGKVRR